MKPVGCVPRTVPFCDDPVPCFARWRERLIAAEQGTGWLDVCDDAGLFLAVSRELAAALAGALRRLAGDSPVLEVCAGAGALAQALAALGVPVQATDAEPPAGAAVLRLSAQAALRHFQPTVVLGVFVPYDAGVDEAVLACPSVQHYVIVNARIGGALGSPSLWRQNGWKSEPLDDIRRWVLTRHDVWRGPVGPGPQTRTNALGNPPPPSGGILDDSRGRLSHSVLQHGEVWHFRRDF